MRRSRAELRRRQPESPKQRRSSNSATTAMKENRSGKNTVSIPQSISGISTTAIQSAVMVLFNIVCYEDSDSAESSLSFMEFLYCEVYIVRLHIWPQHVG